MYKTVCLRPLAFGFIYTVRGNESKENLCYLSSAEVTIYRIAAFVLRWDLSHMNAGLPGKLGLHEIERITLWDQGL